jgi:hypothetical protein
MTCREVIYTSLLLLGAGLSPVVVAQRGQPLPPVTLKPIRGNVYWAPGGTVGNSGVIVGNTGVIVIDSTRLEFLQLAPAHFGGDVVVYLPDQKIVFTGYLIQPAPAFPVIHGA